MYKSVSPKPYNGRYGPVRKPGLIQRRSGFAPEKKRLYTTSRHHPIRLPMKNRKASKINVLIKPHLSVCVRGAHSQSFHTSGQ